MNEPNIRINGFNNAWEKAKIGDITKSFSGGTPAVSVKDFYDGEIPFIRSGEIHEDKTQLKITYKGLKFSSAKYVEKGTLLYALYGATSGEVDLAKISGAINQAILAIIPNEEYDKFFLCSFLEARKSWIISTLLQGGQGNLSGNLVKNIDVCYPPFSEQQEIANFFKSLDLMITLTSKKIEKLKQTLTGCMQTMFPQEGELEPKVRFKGFDGEWKSIPLKEIAKKKTDKNVGVKYDITLTNSAEYGVINQRDFFDHDISNSNNIGGYYIIDNDDFVYNPRISVTAPVGPINRNQLGYTGIMSPLYLIFNVDGINIDYLSCFFKTTLWHNYMKLNGNSGARFDRLAISDDAFFKMPIAVPQDSKEQLRIANYFKSLNEIISLQTKRLYLLKHIKSACLNNMFV